MSIPFFFALEVVSCWGSKDVGAASAHTYVSGRVARLAIKIRRDAEARALIPFFVHQVLRR
jgi:hypothetical protein